MWNTKIGRRLLPFTLAFPFALLAAVVLFLPFALAAAEAPPATSQPIGWSMGDVMALIALIVAGAGMLIDAARAILHFTAPRTTSTWDDSAAAALDQLHEKLADIAERLPPRPPSSVAVLALVLLGFGAWGSLSCSAAQRTDLGNNTKIALVDCTAASAATIAATASSMRSAKPAGCFADGKTDWPCVRSKAINAGIAVGGCAFLEIVSAETAHGLMATAPPDDSGRAAFEDYRAAIAGGAKFRTATGEH